MNAHAAFETFAPKQVNTQATKPSVIRRWVHNLLRIVLWVSV